MGYSFALSTTLHGIAFSGDKQWLDEILLRRFPHTVWEDDGKMHLHAGASGSRDMIDRVLPSAQALQDDHCLRQLLVGMVLFDHHDELRHLLRGDAPRRNFMGFTHSLLIDVAHSCVWSGSTGSLACLLRILLPGGRLSAQTTEQTTEKMWSDAVLCGRKCVLECLHNEKVPMPSNDRIRPLPSSKDAAKEVWRSWSGLWRDDECSFQPVDHTQVLAYLVDRLEYEMPEHMLMKAFLHAHASDLSVIDYLHRVGKARWESKHWVQALAAYGGRFEVANRMYELSGRLPDDDGLTSMALRFMLSYDQRKSGVDDASRIRILEWLLDRGAVWNGACINIAASSAHASASLLERMIALCAERGLPLPFDKDTVLNHLVRSLSAGPRLEFYEKALLLLDLGAVWPAGCVQRAVDILRSGRWSYKEITLQWMVDNGAVNDWR